jgi:hypothetical protein
LTIAEDVKIILTPKQIEAELGIEKQDISGSAERVNYN